MAINPHLNPLCRFCVHSQFRRQDRLMYYICINEDSKEYNQAVDDEAKECNLYRADTNPDDIKESQKQGW